MRSESDVEGWNEEDFAAIWYMLYQNSLNSNITNRALVTKRYCAIDDSVKRNLYSILRKKRRNGEK